MTPVEVIEHYRNLELTDEKGQPWELELEPGISAEQLAEFESALGFTLAEPTRELLRYTNGLSGVPIQGLGFSDLDIVRDTGFCDAFLFLAQDDCGNHWGYALDRTSRDLGPIYFFCHDAPVILYQSPHLSHFLEELFKMGRPPHESLIEEVLEEKVMEVWTGNPGLIPVEEARQSSDKAIAEFAKTLPDDWKVKDLRQPEVGDGFSVGRCREDRYQRHPDYMIFGLDFKEPQSLGQKLKGLFSNKA